MDTNEQQIVDTNTSYQNVNTPKKRKHRRKMSGRTKTREKLTGERDVGRRERRRDRIFYEVFKIRSAEERMEKRGFPCQNFVMVELVSGLLLGTLEGKKSKSVYGQRTTI